MKSIFIAQERIFFLSGCVAFLVLIGLSTFSRNISVLSTIKSLYSAHSGSEALYHIVVRLILMVCSTDTLKF